MFGMTFRAVVVLGFVAVLSTPFIGYAYAARAAESFWHRRHSGTKHAHGVA
jgi:hypothetical protein